MITFDADKKVFFLETKDTEYQIKISSHGYLVHSYYGRKIGRQDTSSLIVPKDRGFSGNSSVAGNDRTFSLDTLPQEYSTFGVGDFRSDSLRLMNSDGSYATELTFESFEIEDGKYSLPNLPAMYANENDHVMTLKILLRDDKTNISVTLLYAVFEELNVITRSTIIKNNADKKISLKKALSLTLDFNHNNFDLIRFYGKHAMERQMERTPIAHGKVSIGSTRGISSHHYNPFVILANSSTTEDFGECYGANFVYSGNFISEIEVDQLSTTRFTMGINPDGFNYVLFPEEEFICPEVILSFSSEGLGALSRQYHQAIRYNICRGPYKLTDRPVLINNWEATYFDFDDEKLVQIAKSAKKADIDMLVMDDGWFGERNDDNTSLGDWYVNEKKIVGGIRKLAKRINETGLEFGIWFEPEMISEKSRLFEKHPDWAIQIPGRPGTRSRNQLVLDYTREEIRDYIFQRLDDILSTEKVAYVKWDMNRSLTNLYSIELSSEQQGEFAHRYVLGLYDLLEKITHKYPNVLFEGCCGGGGRFDVGMLYYTPQIWASDNTDAIDRLRIQYGTSFGYPISTVGSHVSAVPNHQTQRITPLQTRGLVAMSGSFGYELDVTMMSPLELDALKIQVDLFKRLQPLIHNGRYYRLSNPFENESYTAWQFNNENEALLNVVYTRVYANEESIIIKLKGLDDTALYKVEGTNDVYTGAALMYAGFPVKDPNVEYDSAYYIFTKTK